MRSYLAIATIFIVPSIYELGGNTTPPLVIIGLLAMFVGAFVLDLRDELRRSK